MINGQPVCFDGYCGLGGWAEGFLAAGWRVIGFDIERHDYGTGGYPGELVLQDMLTIHGSQFRDADCLVFSPPCQCYSYMAMPWTRSKAIATALRGQGEFPEGYKGPRTIPQLNALFNACFCIQREASEAAGRYIPMVVENVRGAQPWVGRAAWSYGSYYLWGDVPALMPFTGHVQKFNPDGTNHPPGSWFGIADSQNRGARDSQKAPIGNSAPRMWKERDVCNLGDAPGRRAGLKVPGFNFHEHERNGKGGSFQSAAVKESCKGNGSWFNGTYAERKERWSESQITTGSNSSARRAASAQIAKIPFALAYHIGQVYYPRETIVPEHHETGEHHDRPRNTEAAIP